MNKYISLKYEVLHTMTDSDFDQINKMVLSTWDYRSWIPKKYVIPMGEFFLGEVILTSSRIFVARDGDEIIGVIAASLMNNQSQKSNATIRKYKSLKKMASGNKKNFFKLYLDTLILNEKLLLRSGKEFEASLNFFILNENYRGLGIGSKLYSEFIGYLGANDVTEFFLWTDSSSNFNFYENKGLRRIDEEKYSWGSNDDIELYYLYEGKL